LLLAAAENSTAIKRSRSKPKHLPMVRSYHIPSLLYLIVTLLSGIWIRLQWAEPDLAIFNARFLIHAHSHVAMLGWLFLALAGLIAQSGMTAEGQKKMKHPVFLALLHISIVGMTVAFALQGYAFYSILLSTLFVVLSLWFAWLYFRYEDMQILSLVRNFLNAAVFWMVFSSAAPLALAAGSMMGPDWIQGWVSFYLHLQFNGWITFAVTGLIIACFGDSFTSADIRYGNIAFWLLFIGLLPSFEPFIREMHGTLPWITAGMTGALLAFAGTSILIAILIKKIFRYRQHSKALIAAALAGLFLKSMFHAIASIPGPGDRLLETHLFAIGFVHLLLLGFASTAIIWLMLLRFVPLLPGWRAVVQSGILLFLSGAVAMIALLFVFGLFQFLQIPLFLPVQWVLFIAGLPVLAGSILLLISLAVETRKLQ
jgi:hypothetical protein